MWPILSLLILSSIEFSMLTQSCSLKYIYMHHCKNSTNEFMIKIFSLHDICLENKNAFPAFFSTNSIDIWILLNDPVNNLSILHVWVKDKIMGTLNFRNFIKYLHQHLMYYSWTSEKWNSGLPSYFSKKKKKKKSYEDI